MNKVLESLNNDKITLAICLDLSKAFDSVNHELLCKKLEKYGIRGVALQLIQSYLFNRKQWIETDKNGDLCKSTKHVIKKGVPQGSILGPLFYILYTNELPNTTNEFMVLYADDTTLIFSETDKQYLLQKVVNTVELLEKHFFENNLLLNVSKTQTLLFGQKNVEKFSVRYNSEELIAAESVSFLGVNIDRKLNWKLHVSFLAQNIAAYCYALRTISNSISTQAALAAYHAYIQSRVKYGIVFWGNSTEVKRILILQKKCLRSIFQMKKKTKAAGKFLLNTKF